MSLQCKTVISHKEMYWKLQQFCKFWKCCLWCVQTSCCFLFSGHALEKSNVVSKRFTSFLFLCSVFWTFLKMNIWYETLFLNSVETVQSSFNGRRQKDRRWVVLVMELAARARCPHCQEASAPGTVLAPCPRVELL